MVKHSLTSPVTCCTMVKSSYMLYHGRPVTCCTCTVVQSCYMLYHGPVLLHVVPWSSDDQCLVTASLCPPPSDSTLRQPVGNTTLSTAVHRLHQHPSTLPKEQRSEERGQTPCLMPSVAVRSRCHTLHVSFTDYIAHCVQTVFTLRYKSRLSTQTKTAHSLPVK